MKSFSLPATLLFLLFLSPSLAISQWTPTYGPFADGRAFYDLEIIGDSIWASNGGIYSMPLQGDMWMELAPPTLYNTFIEPAGDLLFLSQMGAVTTILPDGRARTRYLQSVSSAMEWLDAGLMVGTTGSVFVSTDSARTFRKVMIDSGAGWVSSLAQSGPHVYAGTYNGLYRSDDTGTTWTRVTNGIPATAFVLQVASEGSRVLASTTDGLYGSSNAGLSWNAMPGAFAGDTVWTLAASEGTWLAGSNTGIYRSSDAGGTWNRIGLGTSRVTAITRSGRIIFAGTKEGVYRSTDDGATWQPIRRGLTVDTVFDLMSFKGLLLAASPETIWRTADSGLNWMPSEGAATIAPGELGTDGTTAFAVNRQELYTSTDGVVWTLRNNTLSTWNIDVVSQLFVWRGVPFVVAGGNTRAIFRFDSTEWKRLDPNPADLLGFYSMASLGDAIVAAGSTGVYVSRDTGTTWRMLGSGLPGPTANVGALFTIGKNVYVSIAFGLYRLADGSTTWEKISDTVGIREVVIGGNGHIYAKGSTMMESADSGRTWTRIDQGIEGTRTNGLALHEDALYTGVMSPSSQGFYESRGVWRMPVAGRTTRVPVMAAPASGVTVAPNPSTGSATISFALVSPAPVSIEIHTADGRLVGRVDRGMLPAGRHTASVDGLASGTYFVSVGGSSYTLVVTR